MIHGSLYDPAFTVGEASTTLIHINLSGWPKGSGSSEMSWGACKNGGLLC